MVIVAAIGTFLVLVDANTRTQQAQLIMTNLTFALDSMTREVRTGKAWVCEDDWDQAVRSEGSTRDCVSGKSISILETSKRLTGNPALFGNNRITYQWKEVGGKGRIYRKLGTTGSWIPLTSSEVDIDSMTFLVSGTNLTDNVQPQATIVIKGTIGNTSIPNKYKTFTLQTTITQNTIDI